MAVVKRTKARARNPPAWTADRRAKQSECIRQVQPWRKSTGPRTLDGKARSSLNALKHGARSREARATARLCLIVERILVAASSALEAWRTYPFRHVGGSARVERDLEFIYKKSLEGVECRLNLGNPAKRKPEKIERKSREE